MNSKTLRAAMIVIVTVCSVLGTGQALAQKGVSIETITVDLWRPPGSTK